MNALSRVIPAFMNRAVRIRLDSSELRKIRTIRGDSGSLRPASDVGLEQLFASPATEDAWEAAQATLRRFDIPDGTDGINPGDRRALFYLIHRFRPVSVLEIGTHIGASTIHIATALSASSAALKSGRPALVSVDIADVNDPVDKRWLRHGTWCSPREMVTESGLGHWVEFVTAPALEHLSRSARTFDFIFLDGSHKAAAVYQEVPAALGRLNAGGLILLHDFFDHLEPLWTDGFVIPGPFLAVQRLRAEGAGLTVLPLGRLPWQTKMRSSTTSLALLLRDD